MSTLREKDLIIENYNDLKAELEKYKLENYSLRMKAENVKNTLSFRLGYTLIHGFKSYDGFIKLPKSLWELRKVSRRKKKKSNVNNIILSQYDRFILRDQSVEGKIDANIDGSCFLKGVVYAKDGEKRNAALISITLSNVKPSRDLAKKLGVSWSEKIGMYFYLPTDQGVQEFQRKINFPKNSGTINFQARRWHSKNHIKLAGVLSLDQETEKKYLSNELVEKILKVYKKDGAQKAVAKLLSDRKIDSEEKNAVLAGLVVLLSCDDRNDIKLLVNHIDAEKLYRIDAQKLINHLYQNGLYKEIESTLENKKELISKQVYDFVQDGLHILNGEMESLPYTNKKYNPVPDSAMCILHCSLPHHSNGYATRSHSILKELKSGKFNVKCFTRQGYPWDVKFPSKPSNDLSHNVDGVLYHHMPGISSRSNTITDYVESASKKIESEALDHKPEIIHACSNYLNALPALVAARRLGVPFVYEVRGFWEVTEASRKPGWIDTDKYKLDKKIETYLVKEADAVVTLTSSMKSDIVNRGVEKDKVFVAPNAVDLDKFIPKTKSAELAAKLGLQEKVTVGYVGSIVSYEGLDDLLKATKQLFDKGIKFNVLIVGDGNELPSLKELSKELKIDDQVIFTGRVPHEEVLDYYSLIDIAPFPRKALEVCELVSPLKPFEAMALKTPIVASNVNAIAEFVEDTKNGLLFDKGSIDSLASKLEKLVTSDSLRERLAKQAFEWVNSNRVWNKTVNEIENAYVFAKKQTFTGKKVEYTSFSKPLNIQICQDDKIELSSNPKVGFVLDGKANYELSVNVFADQKETYKAGVVKFNFGEAATQELADELGLYFSKKVGLFKYLSVNTKGGFKLDFKAPSNVGSANIEFEYWQPNGKVYIGNKLSLDKKYNNKKDAVKEMAVSNKKVRNIAVYGDMNTNLIDGSSIWLVSLAITLSKLPNVNVYIFLKDFIRTTEVIDNALSVNNIFFIEPEKQRLNAKTVVNEFRSFEKESGSFDALVVRGAAACEEFATSGYVDGRLIPYLTDIPQNANDLTDEWCTKIENILYSSKKVLCQTPEFVTYFHENFPQAVTALLPPMIPDEKFATGKKGSNTNPTVFYAGKFAPEWGIRELFDVFTKLRGLYPNAELHVYGDKIHNPKDDPEFHDYVLNTLKSLPGLIWHGRATRNEVLAALCNADIAWGWRHSILEDHTHELSTKLLEYALSEVPVLLNRSKLYEKALGQDYKLFAKNTDTLLQLCTEVITADSKKPFIKPLVTLCDQHKFSYVANQHLRSVVEELPTRKNKTILVAGHDLKFFTALEASFRAQGYDVLIDQWAGHNKHDEGKSRELIEKADIIVCEWCLGNAVWYTNNKKPHQKIIIRFHLQEINLPYPADMDYDNVEKIVFVSHHLKRDVLSKFGWEDSDKLIVVPNYSKTELLDKPKYEGAQYNLGIVGIVPERKRFDLALDILENLRKKDKRYKLFVKGKIHTDFPWMKNRKDEIAYYEEQMERIESNPYLKGAVHFDGFGNDMANWYRKVGYVLSTSDFESFHLSVADSAASKSIPVVLPWVGAEEIYSSEFVVKSTVEASDKIVKNNKSNSFEVEAAWYQQYIKSRYTLHSVVNSWEKILSF